MGRAAKTGKVSWMATGAGARVALHERQAARFQEVSGNTVELVIHNSGPYEEKLFSLFAAGTAPDIFRLEGPFIPVMVAQGKLGALDDYIRRDRVDTADIFEKGLAMYRWQGKQYALPWLAYRVLFFNVDLLEKNGVPLPPTDWADKKWNQAAFVGAVKRFGTAGAPPQPGGTWAYGSPLSGQDAWVWSLGNGGDVLSEDDKRFVLDQPAAVEGLQYFADLINVHKAHPTPSQAKEDATLGAFLAGRSAFYFGAVATAGSLATAPFRADAAPIPWGSKGTPTTGGGHSWPLNKASADPEVAWQLQRFLSGKENDLLQVQSGEAPPFRKSTGRAQGVEGAPSAAAPGDDGPGGRVPRPAPDGADVEPDRRRPLAGPDPRLGGAAGGARGLAVRQAGGGVAPRRGLAPGGRAVSGGRSSADERRAG